MIHTLAIAALAVRMAAIVPDSTELSGDALITALRSGGYTILLRHTQTDWTAKEGQNYVVTDRSTQRNLSEQGVLDAKTIGVVMKRYGVPIGEILASPMFRTRETAEYAFGPPTASPELLQGAASAEQRAVIAAAPKAAAYPAAAATTPVGTPPALPATASGRLAGAYIRAFNTGEADAMRHFLVDQMVSDPARPIEARLETYQALRSQHGTIAVLAVESTSEDETSLRIRTNSGELTLTARVGRDQGGRGTSISIASGAQH
jgi:phosphohistidine phosphatase SixA